MTEREAELEKELALLTEHKQKLDKEIDLLKLEKQCLHNLLNTNLKFLEGIKPIYVWHHVKRNNTTVKFLNGSTTTVHKGNGEEDCLETAIVYAIVKHIFGKKEIQRLAKLTKEINND